MESLSFVFEDRATVPGFLGLDVQEELLSHLLEVNPDKILLVCDKTAFEIHGDYFEPLAPTVGAPGETLDANLKLGVGQELPGVEKFILPSGDEAKTWDYLTELVQWAFDVEATKKSLVVAFGGGALLNVAGLFASLLYRGMKLMYIPTTFLAMHDVVTSLKTSICCDGRKNNIGTFYAPMKILIDVTFCNSLPRGELFSGIGELAKNAVLMGGKHAEGFIDALSKEQIDAANGGSGEEFVLEMETLQHLLRLGIEAKMSVLAEDAYEKNSGMIFEYGHTVSHAIEKAYGDGVIPHGLGVTYGMLSSSYAAERLGIMSTDARRRHDEICWLLLKRWALPEPKPLIEDVVRLALRDSKRGLASEAEDEIADVLLRAMGEVLATQTSMLSKFPKTLLAEWMATMGFPSRSEASEAAPSASEAGCRALLERVAACRNDRQLAQAGLEPMTVGYACRACRAEHEGRPVVAKSYLGLVFMRLAPEAAGKIDVLAGERGVGPCVMYSSSQGIVTEHLPGRTLREADMHKEDKSLLEAVALALGKLHQLPTPNELEGTPMLWRTIDKMIEVALQRPDLLPTTGFPGAGPLLVEVQKAKEADVLRRSKIVLGHGDFKPSNMLYHEGTAKIVDFELAGPNYRGYDLFKVFRTALPFSQDSLRHFLRAYLLHCNEPATENNVEALLSETLPFEPLTWLEAAVFFLTLPQFLPEETARWHSLAADRWIKFSETKWKMQ